MAKMELFSDTKSAKSNTGGGVGSGCRLECLSAPPQSPAWLKIDALPSGPKGETVAPPTAPPPPMALPLGAGAEAGAMMAVGKALAAVSGLQGGGGDN